jgi:polar amino acid transport system substrate-binding protein
MRTDIFLFGWVLLAFTQCAAVAATIHAKEIRVGTILHIQPDHPTVHLVKKAYAELGFEMILERLPTERAILEMNRGELLDANLAATVLFESHNPALIRVPVPIYQLEFAVFSNRPALKITEWSQLLPYNVVVIKGMLAVEQALAQNQGQQIEAVMSLEQALRQLELGRNHLAVLPKFEAEAMLNVLQLKKVRVLSPSLAIVPAYHYVHSKHKSLVAPLTEVLARLTGQPIEVLDDEGIDSGAINPQRP